MNWQRPLRQALVSGSTASILSAIALAVCGKVELDDSSAPLNGPSQWLFGTDAACEKGFSLKHTVSGYLIHHAMSCLWALVFEFARARRATQAGDALVPAATTSALACFVDFQLTPRRLTPGFERQLSRKSLAVAYVAFALGLAAGAAVQSNFTRRRT